MTVRRISTNQETNLLDDLIGTSVFVRTVTFHYTGKLVAADDSFLQLDDAAWIADSGRFSEALETGNLSEVEPYPGSCFVSLGAIVDISNWQHELPKEKK